MNCFRNFFFYAVLAVTLIAQRAPLFAATISEKPQEGRLLFLVETSAATDNERATIRKVIRNILESGLGGHMQYGDTIGLWTYGEKANTDFPMALWTHEYLQDVENAIDFWMTKQKFKGRANFSQLQAPLQKVIKASQKMTVVWISAGEGQITGTPFDKEIAELHKEFGPNFRKQRIPFVTLLAVRKGAVVDFTVNPGDATIRLPDVFEKEDAAAAAAAAAVKPPPVEPTPPPVKKPPLIIRVGPSPELIAQKTNAAAATNALTPAPTNSVAPTNAASQPLTTNTTAVAQPTVQSNAPAAAPANTPAPPVVAKPQAVVPASVQTNAAAVATNVPATTTTGAPVAVVSKTNAPLATTAPTNSNTNATASASPVVHNPKPPSAISSTPMPVATAVGPAPNYMLYMVFALGPILVLIGAYLRKKSRAPKGASLISQSMTRERVSSDVSKPSSDKPVGPE